MPHVWVHHEGEWAIAPAGARALVLDSWIDGANLRAHPLAPRLCRVGRPDTASWLLLSRPGDVTVNGLPVPGGLRVLSDRDEIRVQGSSPVYFSTETLAAVESLPASDQEVVCARCRQAIEPDTSAVRCPGCGLWHHASDEYPCWTYAPTCALCPQPTDDGAGFQWTPEDL